MSLIDEIKASQPAPTIELTPEGREAYRAYCNRSNNGRSDYSVEERISALRDAERMDWNRIAACAVAASRASTPHAFPSAGLSGPPGMTLWDYYFGKAIEGNSSIDMTNPMVIQNAVETADLAMEARAKRLGGTNG